MSEPRDLPAELEMLAQRAATSGVRNLLYEAARTIRALQDLPLCRRQLPDGRVPENTEAALYAWHKLAEDALRALQRRAPDEIAAIIDQPFERS